MKLDRILLTTFGLLIILWGLIIYEYGWNSWYEKVEEWEENGHHYVRLSFPWERHTPYTFFLSLSLILSGSGFIFLVNYGLYEWEKRKT